MRGRFISLEGVDGSGKSTQAVMLADALRDRGHDVVAVREPGGTPLGEGIREVVLGPDAMSPWAEAFLFAAARAQLVCDVIAPALAAGSWVVADRFLDSSLAYQGFARGLGIDLVAEVNAPGIAGVLPDVTIILNIAPGAAVHRRSGHRNVDRIEGEGEALQESVAEGYREVARRFPDRIYLVSAAGALADVHTRVLATVIGAT
ncbi:MAG: dTMP kinase [Thermoleophilia bacterium]|nr:dTMP kinase [Thermoleophilia bacterium]